MYAIRSYYELAALSKLAHTIELKDGTPVFREGDAADAVYVVAVDAVGDLYLTGATSSTDFPTTPSSFAPTSPPPYNAFVTKVTADRNNFV